MKKRKFTCLPCIARRIRMALGNNYKKGVESAVVDYFWEKFPHLDRVIPAIIDYEDFIKSDYYLNYGSS